MLSELEKLTGRKGSIADLYLEFDPRATPLVSQDEFNVVYIQSVMHPSSEEIDSNVQPDFVLEQRSGSQISAGKDVVAIIARRVIEKAPDLLGWLEHLISYAGRDTVIGLKISDKRLTLDGYRPLSTLGEVFAAWLSKRKMPYSSQVFDATLYNRPVNCTSVWERHVQHDFQDVSWDRLQLAASRATLADKGRYLDGNCWVFSPESFLFILEGLAQLNLLPLAVETVIPAEIGEDDFVVRLRLESDKVKVIDSIENARLLLAEHPSSVLHYEAGQPGALRSATLENYAQGRLKQLSELKQRYNSLQEQLAASELEIDRLRFTMKSIEALVIGE